jgi:hypothetical protein
MKIKTRNFHLLALWNNQPKHGPHGKTRKALRRLEKNNLNKEIKNACSC